MGTGWKMQKKTMIRPRKSGAEKNRRMKVQRRRLVALGMSEAEVAKMNPRKVKDLLKYPVRTARILKAKKA